VDEEMHGVETVLLVASARRGAVCSGSGVVELSRWPAMGFFLSRWLAGEERKRGREKT
jgi:hypothetical protein